MATSQKPRKSGSRHIHTSKLIGFIVSTNTKGLAKSEVSQSFNIVDFVEQEIPVRPISKISKESKEDAISRKNKTNSIYTQATQKAIMAAEDYRDKMNSKYSNSIRKVKFYITENIKNTSVTNSTVQVADNWLGGR